MKKLNNKLRNLVIIFAITIVSFIYSNNVYADTLAKQTWVAENITITLHLTAQDNLSGVSKVRISNYKDFRGVQWEDYSEEKEFTFDNIESKIIYTQYMDNAGNISEVYSKAIPERFFEETILINKDDLYTNKDKLILNIKTTEDAKEISLSNDRKNWTPWELFKKQIEYNINSDEGKKEIYIQFKNKDNQIIKKFIPGIFIYDKTCPVIENIQLSLDKNTNKVNVSADIHDNLSGIHCEKWALGKVNLDYFKNHGTNFNANNIVLDKNGEYTLYAEDKAGNVVIKNFTVNLIKNTSKEDKEDNKNTDNKKVDNKNNSTSKSKNNEDNSTSSNGHNRKDVQVVGTNKNIGDNIETTDKKTVVDVVSEDKKDIASEKNETNIENNTIDSNNNISNNTNGKTNKNNIGNDNSKNNSKKKVYSKGLKHLWLWWILLLIIIYIVWRKYKESKKRKN